MKTLVIALFVTFFAAHSFAQDISFRQSGNNILNPFYADIVSKAATLNGDWGLFGGMRAGYNVNENFSVGLIGHGLIPDQLGNSYINQKDQDELHLGYGGIESVIKLDLSDRFFLTGNIMVGAGRVDYEEMDGNDYFFITEPGASVNYRIRDWFGVGYSVNYRFASGVKYADFSDESFSGWSTDISLKFGF